MNDVDEQFARLEEHLENLRTRTQGVLNDSNHVMLRDVIDALLTIRREQETLQRAVGALLISETETRRRRSFDPHQDVIRFSVSAPVPTNARFVFAKEEAGVRLHVEVPDPDESTTWDKIKSG